MARNGDAVSFLRIGRSLVVWGWRGVVGGLEGDRVRGWGCCRVIMLAAE